MVKCSTQKQTQHESAKAKNGTSSNRSINGNRTMEISYLLTFVVRGRRFPSIF